MKHPLFKQIDKFENWAHDYSEVPEEDRAGEWECTYDNWLEIYTQFDFFINTVSITNWTSEIKNRLLYIIARDNEMEVLSKLLPDKNLVVLAEYAIFNGNRDSKWQMAAQLGRLSDKSKAIELLDLFVNDKEEYVNRRSLLELANLDKERTEYYCKIFWVRDIYNGNDEYQKIAVLHALKASKSPLLLEYLLKAKIDGRKYLLQNVEEIESDLAHRNKN